MQPVSELFYLPPVSFFQAIATQESLLLEAAEHYQKQSYRNRCIILTAAGPKPLIIPVLHMAQKMPVREVEIDYSQRWATIHWRTIVSAYASSPYFLYYADGLKEILCSGEKLLFELNLALLHYCLKCMNLNISINFTSDFKTQYALPVVDIRNQIHPKRPADKKGITSYPQVFGRSFVSNLSCIDLLFNLGPESAIYLQTQR